jgi:hypothetical protein
MWRARSVYDVEGFADRFKLTKIRLNSIIVSPIVSTVSSHLIWTLRRWRFGHGRSLASCIEDFVAYVCLFM